MLKPLALLACAVPFLPAGAEALGVGHVGGTPAPADAGLPHEEQTPGKPNRTRAKAGILDRMSPSRARLPLPAPVLEADVDILDLTRGC